MSFKMNYVKKISNLGDGGFVFYRDRDDWRDVTPIAQNDGPVPVVLIAYSDRWIPLSSVVMALKCPEPHHCPFWLQVQRCP